EDGDVLQPVLVLGRYGLSNNENSTELSKVGKWAQSMGAIVIVLPSLSFQDKVNISHIPPGPGRDQASMGPFIRLDIPRLVEEYGLMDGRDSNNICPQHVLYTDSDVIFSGSITHEDIQSLKQGMLDKETAIVSYGREYSMHPSIINTGVMLMDVPAFAKEWPTILEWTLQQPTFPIHDQLLLNNYFTEPGQHRRMQRAQLPIEWNWKPYWKVPFPEAASKIKILHFHGPKPGKSLEELATCGIDGPLQHMIGRINAYEGLLLHGLCCDLGQTANWAMELFNYYVTPDVC
ncbi:MAG: hypothetical protein SGILL_006736, partial [Bacillariaceae sp.]